MRQHVKRRPFLVSALGTLAMLLIVIGGAARGSEMKSNATIPVTCKIMPAIEATFPAALDLGSLEVGSAPVTSPSQIVTVCSNAPWALKIRSDAQDGCLREWTGTGYATPSPRTLSSPLEWKCEDQTEYTAISGTDAPLVTDRPPTGSAGTPVSFIFRQSASYEDEALPDPSHSYRIEVTYTATQTY